MSGSLILGTAGHIDHGKTELVKALTGVDTDRLKEEKERGITIDLGFAELRGGDVRLGVVDVPGHEGFVRNMLAGATGMDVVLLAVAADEGVMPQTREHLAILRLLGVDRVVVALTKADLVEEDWLELVREEVTELLESSGLKDAPVLPTSTRTGRGLESLTRALLDVAAGAGGDAEDLARLPVDRAFTVRGTGTVVTGTLWTGRLRARQRVRLLPGDVDARIRGLQVHGRDVEEAVAGQRTAVALSGADVDLDRVGRGQTLVDHDAWTASSMMNVRLELLPDSAWTVESGQRVRVHAGTNEAMARVVLLDRGEPLGPGSTCWAQLRMESPTVARVLERIVLRSYSPVMTIGGATVVEAPASKRGKIDGDEAKRLGVILEGVPDAAIPAAVAGRGWAGLSREVLPLATGRSPSEVTLGIRALLAAGGMEVQGRLMAPDVVAEARRRLEAAVDAHHEAEPLRPGVPVDQLRAELPARAAPGLADAVLEAAAGGGTWVVERGRVARVGFQPRLTAEQERVREALVRLYREAGLQPPSVEELPAEMRGREDLWPLLRLLEDEGRLHMLDEGLFADAGELERAGGRIREGLGGRTGLGPADFREALPVSRKHLLPLLGYFDRAGVTVRREDGREVPSGPDRPGSGG